MKKTKSGSQRNLSASLYFDVWLNVLSLFLTFQVTPSRVSFTATRHLSSETWLTKFRVTTTILHTTLDSFHLSRKRLTITVGVNCVPVIYGIPALRSYATMHVFRCIIWVSWDLIKITASKIPFKWNCSQKTMADTSSCRLFLFFAHQQRKANPCFHDGRQEGHKLCCFLTLLMLLCYVTHIKYTANY